MTQQYLRFCNEGITDYRSFLLLGCSTSRGVDGKIGEYGSGAKFSLALLLRSEIKPIIYIGNLKMEFNTKDVVINNQVNKQIIVHLSGRMPDGTNVRRTEDLNMTLHFGQHDWSDTLLACREFCSNMLDGAVENTGSYRSAVVDISDNPRASRGYTQVFIPLTAEVKQFFDILPEWFLHFSKRYTPESEIMLKDKAGPAKIYCHGVLVRQIGENSLFDYNINNLNISESRTSDEYSCRSGVCSILCKPQNKSSLMRVLRETSHNKDLFEASISQYQWAYYKDSIAAAYIEEFGEKSVLCNGNTADHVQRKGYVATILDESFASVLRTVERLNKDSKILSGAEVKGFSVSAPTDLVIKAADTVWDTLKYLDMTNGKNKPEVQCMWKAMDSGGKIFGLYDNGKVFVDKDLSGIQLTQTLVEEFSHHCTNGAADGSRDLQDFSFNLVARMIN